MHYHITSRKKGQGIFLKYLTLIDFHPKLVYRPVAAKENEDWELSTVS